jgi:nucleoside-specific outer membrane channel protein Tsx
MKIHKLLNSHLDNWKSHESLDQSLEVQTLSKLGLFDLYIYFEIYYN